MGERVGHTAAVDCTCHLGKAPYSTWFCYFRSRMQTRHKVRCGYLRTSQSLWVAAVRSLAHVTPSPWSAWRRLAPFLPAWSTRYIEPGNSAALLARAERQLGQPLPVEFWELYRFQSGQALHNMVGVQFIDGLRFVRCGEHA